VLQNGQQHFGRIKAKRVDFVSFPYTHTETHSTVMAKSLLRHKVSSAGRNCQQHTESTLFAKNDHASLPIPPAWVIMVGVNWFRCFAKVLTFFTRCDVVGTWSREYQLSSSSSSSSSSSYSYYQMRLCRIWSRNAENSSALFYVVKNVTKSHD
jgi:hypothetical protein